ncbi:MAG: hypothetical protein OEV66_11265 [Spirochaetia bacterium]|nr:hypothetical protein [Spirochaetia bacterium]
MNAWNLSLAKITSPDTTVAYPRQRLFDLLDKSVKSPVVWISAQGGSGKTTLVSSWLNVAGFVEAGFKPASTKPASAKRKPAATIWYQIDEGDADIASFFYYMGLAAQKIAPKNKQKLPLFTPEYSQSLPVFTRRYFENLYGHLLKNKKRDRPGVIVFDNYQLLPTDSPFHEMMAHALDVIPEGVTVIFISRALPPSQFARFSANHRLRLIGWEDIRFNRDEFGGMFKTQTKIIPEAQDVDAIYSKTDGWIAGLILLSSGVFTRGVSEHLADMPTDRLFDYFASEIFDKTDPVKKEFLLKTSFVEKIDAAIVRELTQNKKAGQILEQLSRDHFFTQKIAQSYQYHHLFRAFLQDRAKTIYTPDAIADVQRKAAELLEQSGCGEEAIALYIAAADWTGAERVALKQAQALVSQGRNNTLEAWLNDFPRERIDHSPWLLFWFAICQMPYNPAQARDNLERAFEGFESAGDIAGLFLSSSQIADSFIHEWGDVRPADRWIKALGGLTQKYNYPSGEIESMVVGSMVGILAHRQPSHPEYTFWEEKLEKIVLNYADVDVNVKLLSGCNLMNSYNNITGNEKAIAIFQSLQHLSRQKNTATLSRLFWCIQEARYIWMTGDLKSVEETILWGLGVAEESGVHLLDPYIVAHGIFAGLAWNRPELTRFYREKYFHTMHSPRLLDKAAYHYTEASVEWYHKNFQQSLEHSKVAIEFAKAADCPWILSFCFVNYSLTLFDIGNIEEAMLYHKKGGDYGKDLAIPGYLYNMIGAKIYLGVGDHARGLEFLSAGMKLGKKNGYTNMDRWDNQNMSRLCAIALEHNIEPEYARFLIQKRHLVPDSSIPVPENWPYPLKIFTLGRFDIIKDGQPMEFSGAGAKVQQKPLALLKLLIAYGGKNVDEAQISDVLWPDAPGDSAHSSFAMALHRLRKLIGEDVIELSEGRLTLNQGICPVDVFLLENLLKMAENAWVSQPPEAEKALDLTMQAVHLYGEGSFLPGADYSLFIAGFREKLSGKIRRILLSAATHFEQVGSFEKARGIIEQAHLFDDLSEEIIQRMMLAHLQLGRNSEAIQLFQSWRDRIMVALGAAPSEKTMEIYNGLIN